MLAKFIGEVIAGHAGADHDDRRFIDGDLRLLMMRCGGCDGFVEHLKIFFADAKSELPMRRIVRGISRVFRGEKPQVEVNQSQDRLEPPS